MKKLIAFIPTYVLFGIGDFTCDMMYLINTEKACNILYPIYNKAMVWSCFINDWGGLKLWTDTNGN